MNEICPICSAVLDLAGDQHHVWDARIMSLFAGTESFENLDRDPITRLPDGMPLKALNQHWLSVKEYRELLQEDSETGEEVRSLSLAQAIAKFGQPDYTLPKPNDPEADFAATPQSPPTPVEPEPEPEVPEESAEPVKAAPRRPTDDLR